MRVVFHLKYFRAGRIGGQENVIRGLAAGLAASPLDREQKLFALCPSAEREAVAGMCPWTDIVPVESDAGERVVQRALRKLRPDLYVCPMAVVEPADPPCPVVVGVPDLQHETYPDFFTPEVLANRRRTYGSAIHGSDLVLTFSGYSRRTILEHYPETDPERIVVAWPSVGPTFESALETALPAGPFGTAPYLLFPANFWPHKNHVRLLDALVSLRAEGLAPPLALTGDPGSGWDRVERQTAERGLADQVRFLGWLPAGELVALLRGARALVFPSLYEGFGLPILEAFHCDTPVLCSNVASCPEVAGDAALLLDPASVASIAEGLRRIWTDGELRADLVERGRRRRTAMEPDQTLEKVRAALLGLVSQRRPRRGPLRRFLHGLGVGSLTP